MKDQLLVTIFRKGCALYNRADWSLVIHSDSPIEATDKVDSLYLDQITLPDHVIFPEQWNWIDLTAYLRHRFAIPEGWTESGDAMIVPPVPANFRTVESKTYDTPEGERAIDALGNHYRIEIVGDGEVGFVAILNENLTNDRTSRLR